MNRLVLLLIVSAAVGIAGFLFQVKYRVQDLERELAGLNAQILHDREAMHVLRTEWSYLNQPDRIAALAQRHLEMDVMEPLQVASFDILPPRPEDFGYAQADLENVLPEPRRRPDGLQPGTSDLQIASLEQSEPQPATASPAQQEERARSQPSRESEDDIGDVIARLIGEAPVSLEREPAFPVNGGAVPISASGGVLQ